MADSLASAAIAAGAALFGSAVTGYITLQGIHAKSKSDRDDLTRRLEHETAAARETREQERRQHAYTSLLAYVNLLRYFMKINFDVYRRETNAIAEVRTVEGPFNAGSPAEKAALEAVGPTEEEQKDLDAGPTPKERAEIIARVDALASDEVRRQFSALNSTINDLSDEMINVRIILRRSIRPELAAVNAAKAASEGGGKNSKPRIASERRPRQQKMSSMTRVRVLSRASTYWTVIGNSRKKSATSKRW